MFLLHVNLLEAPRDCVCVPFASAQRDCGPVRRFGQGDWRRRNMDTGADGARTPVETLLLPNETHNKQ
eukprot:4347430-Lingulodinium_polyedra.AAC.1